MALNVPLVLLLSSLASFAMLFALAVLWLRTWRETQSRFSLALVAFAVILAFQEVTRLLLFFGRAAGRPLGEGLRGLELLGVVGQVVALAILLWFVSR